MVKNPKTCYYINVSYKKAAAFGGDMDVKNALIDCFLQYGHKIVVEKDEVILNASDPSQNHSAFFLESGLVGLTTISKAGEERIYLYFNSKRLIGFAQLLMAEIQEPAVGRMRKIGHADVFLIAKTRCVLYQLRGPDYKRLLDTDFQFNKMVLRVLISNYVDLLDHFQQAMEESAGTRFCRLLLESYIEKDGKKVLPKSLTFLEMSKYLGTHPVTVSRIVALLKKDGCIAKEQGMVVIKDEGRLLEMIETGEEIK